MIMAAHYELPPVQHHYGPTLGQQFQKDNDCVDFLSKTAQKILVAMEPRVTDTG